ncbi:MAG TPA: GNAT family N-acetyltransferase [Pyrinomonadaceae bacterium]|nr:GNAT family N-acetyltransferase [Pyrinomonadaceae bacterium]
MVTIRTTDIGDGKVLAQLNAFVQELHLQHRSDHFKETSVPDLEAWYESLLETPTTKAWIAEVNGQPVGYVLALCRDLRENPFTRARTWLEVDQLAVDPNYRRQGVGRELVRKVIAYAQETGFAGIEASSWSFNQEAHQLFGQLGFVPKVIRFELHPGDSQ